MREWGNGVGGPPYWADPADPVPLHPPAVTHAVLAVLAELPAGPYSLPLLLRDSGTPPREQQQLLNVSVCPCGRDGLCDDGVLAAATAGVGVALEALVIIVGSAVLLLSEWHRRAPPPPPHPTATPAPLLHPHGPHVTPTPYLHPCHPTPHLHPASLAPPPDPPTLHPAVLVLLGAAQVRSRRRAQRRGLLQRWGDDVRDNVLNYDEQGGGEEDQVGAPGRGSVVVCVCGGEFGLIAPFPSPQDAYDLTQLRHPPPHGRPPLRRDAPLRSATPPGSSRRPPRGPSDIEDFINEVRRGAAPPSRARPVSHGADDAPPDPAGLGGG